MELRYPILFIVLIVIIVIILISIKKKDYYKEGSKIANTSFIKNTEYYKKKEKKYKLFKKIFFICLIISLFISIFMISRLAKISSSTNAEYNRDIILCMDVSTSLYSFNDEMVEALKETVSSLDGERFGISIFNTSSVLLVPLTDDYNYVLDVLDTIHEAISQSADYSQDDYYYMRNYITSGTLEGNETKGSSLIGDGLASCIYDFTDDDRPKIVIFTTDNQLSGTPIVTLSEASDIGKQEGVIVYGVAAGNITVTEKEEFKEAILKTGGSFYDSTSSADEIVSDIEKTSKSLIESESKTTKEDIPTIPFILLLISISIMLIAGKKVSI